MRQHYLQAMERKTAMSFSLACESGAALVESRTRWIWALSQFGRRFGRAFQVMDDLLDFVQPLSESGKAQSTDLLRRRYSLPLIYALEELPQAHVARSILAGQSYTAEELREATTSIIATGGFMRAYAEARGWVLEGGAILDRLPASPFREALRQLALYVVNRGFAPAVPR
jgi:heptaprenyl diphosphate synthase